MSNSDSIPPTCPSHQALPASRPQPPSLDDDVLPTAPPPSPPRSVDSEGPRTPTTPHTFLGSYDSTHDARPRVISDLNPRAPPFVPHLHQIYNRLNGLPLDTPHRPIPARTSNRQVPHQSSSDLLGRPFNTSHRATGVSARPPSGTCTCQDCVDGGWSQAGVDSNFPNRPLADAIQRPDNVPRAIHRLEGPRGPQHRPQSRLRIRLHHLPPGARQRPERPVPPPRAPPLPDHCTNLDFGPLPQVYGPYEFPLETQTPGPITQYYNPPAPPVQIFNVSIPPVHQYFGQPWQAPQFDKSAEWFQMLQRQQSMDKLFGHQEAPAPWQMPPAFPPYDQPSAPIHNSHFAPPPPPQSTAPPATYGPRATGPSPGLFLHHTYPCDQAAHTGYGPNPGDGIIELPLPPCRSIPAQGTHDREYLTWKRAAELGFGGPPQTPWEEYSDRFWRAVGEDPNLFWCPYSHDPEVDDTNALPISSQQLEIPDIIVSSSSDANESEYDASESAASGSTRTPKYHLDVPQFNAATGGSEADKEPEYDDEDSTLVEPEPFEDDELLRYSDEIPGVDCSDELPDLSSGDDTTDEEDGPELW